MLPCCVSGCHNRRTSTSKVKFFKIPRGSSPLQAKRRRLWIKAIGEANGGTEDLKGSARVCGAHFMSGEQSLNPRHPDFVPSLFTRLKLSSKRSEKVEREDELSPIWYYGLRDKRHKDYTEFDDEENSPSVDLPVDLQSSVLMNEEEEKEKEVVEEELAPMEEETNVEETECNLEVKAEASTPRFQSIDNRIPVVRLKSIFARSGHYQCEYCQQSFIEASQLVKHQKSHEDLKPSVCEVCGVIFTSLVDFTEHQLTHKDNFPCNMCNRFFPSSQSLKRHKLLHIRDGRKCRICGVLFCRRHNHVLYLPQSGPAEEPFINEESQQVDSNVEPDNSVEVKSEPNQTPISEDNDQSDPTPASPEPPAVVAKTKYVLPPNLHGKIIVFISPKSLKDIPKRAPLIQQPEQPRQEVRQLKQLELPKKMVSWLNQPKQPKEEVSWLNRPKQPKEDAYRLNRPKQPKEDAYQLNQPEQPKAEFSWLKVPELPKEPELPPSLQMFSKQYLTSAFLKVNRNYKYILSKNKVIQKKKMKEEEEEEEVMCSMVTVPVKEQTVETKYKRIAYDMQIVL